MGEGIEKEKDSRRGEGEREIGGRERRGEDGQREAKERISTCIKPIFLLHTKEYLIIFSLPWMEL